MNEDEKDIEAFQREKRQEQDLDDLNNERAGNQTGRAARFGILKSDQQEQELNKRKRTAFDILMQDAEYRAAWENAISALNQANTLIYQALTQAGDRLTTSRQSHQNLLDRAATLPGGERVFLDVNGEAYNENGEQLSIDELASIEWGAAHPSWEAYRETKSALESAKQDHDTILNQQTRLDKIRTALEDTDNPTSIENIELLTEEINGIAMLVSPKTETKQQLEVKQINASFVPDLGL